MTKRIILPLQDEYIYLRLLKESDLELTREWRNQEHIRMCFFYSGIITPVQHKAWFKQYLNRDDDFVFIIVDKINSQAVGQIALYRVDWNKKQAEYGRLMIGIPEAARKGFAKSATILLLALGFEQFELNTIYLEVFANNTKALNLYQSTGFKITTVRDNIVKMEITREQYSYGELLSKRI